MIETARISAQERIENEEVLGTTKGNRRIEQSYRTSIEGRRTSA